MHCTCVSSKYIDVEDEGQDICPNEDTDDADAGEIAMGPLFSVPFVSSIRCAAASYPYSKV